MIPPSAVIGWYQKDFLPRGPGVITVTGIQMRSWTWEVTGITYPNTAEVAFTQPFADGSVVNDVVRLVESDGEWRWFFGRTREFVDEQIARFSGSAPESAITSQSGSAATSPSSDAPSSPLQPLRVITAEELLGAVMYTDELPAGTGFSGKERTFPGSYYGPLFGAMDDDLGASWINVYISGPPDGMHTFLLQYAVFSSAEEAQAAFHSSALQSRLGQWPNGTASEFITITSSSAAPGIAWWGASSNPSLPMNPSSAKAGVAALSGNVIVFTNITQIALAPHPALAPDLNQVMQYAYDIAAGSILHIDRLRT